VLHLIIDSALRLRYNNALADAAADLGPPEQIRSTFVGFQRLLYQDAVKFEGSMSG
jgi:type I restriction enzyme R subunit